MVTGKGYVFGHKVDIVRIPEPSRDFMKAVIEKRLRYAEAQGGVRPNSGIIIEESAYDTTSEISHNNPCLALLLFRLTAEHTDLCKGSPPYRMTSEHVKSLDFNYEKLCKYWDSPLRDVVGIHIKPYWK